MMQAVNHGTHPGKSSVTFLPMIDMDASDMSCVYSTIRSVAADCRRQHLKSILTFDQPLWRKAQLIIANEPRDSDLSSVASWRILHIYEFSWLHRQCDVNIRYRGTG